MSPNEHFHQLARYNLWADEQLLQHLIPLTDQQYKQNNGLFFKSVHGTLNHQLLGSSAWYGRLSQQSFSFDRLDQELHEDRQSLTEALLQKSRDWIIFANNLPEARFDEILSYRTSKGIEVSLPFAGLLTHAFNHATHHRGQITAIITRFEYPSPEIDLVYYLLEQ